MNPPPRRIGPWLAEDVDPCPVEFGSCQVKVVHPEQRNDPSVRVTQELEVLVSWREELHPVAVGGGQLDSRPLVELDSQPQDSREELDCCGVSRGGNADPHQAFYVHRASMTVVSAGAVKESYG